MFDFHDSFDYFAYVIDPNCAAHPQAAHLFSRAPLRVLLNRGVAGMIDTVDRCPHVRLCGLVMLSASGAVIVGVLRA